ncbi:peroxiredoxin [Atribacter laminatus]|uniref:Peroxiredoxin n=1 Tax=Atribacter laminatus TaxID=2847778 RepID=A0A7T1F2N5_ATRLM|nr:peroxiredoxin [Atribacter laminatus]QPM67501.1 Selenocysteine-containing peroxiredoxin PrxU [Atribacter laminatus]
MEEMVKEVCHHPRLNEKAPNFEAVTTHGKIKLSDYANKWVVMFSHPADFTPVCTTEFVAFSKANEEFKKRNTQLIGLSIDSIHAHLGWVASIEKNFGVKVPFPIIADLDMKVANLYGMVHPAAGSTAAVRSVFIIDDEGILKALIHYPMSNGRNIDEVIRLLDALQTSKKNGVATPANWKPGEKVIVPPPQTQDDMYKRKDMGYEYIDWYLSYKNL